MLSDVQYTSGTECGGAVKQPIRQVCAGIADSCALFSLTCDSRSTPSAQTQTSSSQYGRYVRTERNFVCFRFTAEFNIATQYTDRASGKGGGLYAQPIWQVLWQRCWKDVESHTACMQFTARLREYKAASQGVATERRMCKSRLSEINTAQVGTRWRHTNDCKCSASAHAQCRRREANRHRKAITARP